MQEYIIIRYVSNEYEDDNIEYLVDSFPIYDRSYEGTPFFFWDFLEKEWSTDPGGVGKRVHLPTKIALRILVKRFQEENHRFRYLILDYYNFYHISVFMNETYYYS